MAPIGDVERGGAGRRERKRSETRLRIATEAAKLASADGTAATTVDAIAQHAGVGRATFFRYFESKDLAIATGLSEVAVFVLSGVLADAPAELGPLEAIRAAYAELGRDFEPNRQMFLDQALLTRSSPSMLAWTLHLYVDWEIAIADAVAPRFVDLAPGDPRPRMLGAMTMAAARLACDEWVLDGGRGDLPTLIQHYLATIEVRSLATI